MRRGHGLRVLLLCDEVPGEAQTVSDHIGALLGYSRHDVVRLNPRPHRHLYEVDLELFDVVILHYSIYILSDRYLSPSFRERLRRYRGLKVQFVQDDYRDVSLFVRGMDDLGIHLLFTLVPESRIPKTWRRYRELDRTEIHSTLAGFVPERLEQERGPRLRDRPLDVCYRGRTLPFWLGALGQEKVWIGQRFLEHAYGTGLRCDIGWQERDRLYGGAWLRLMRSSRAVLGTESGASITDFDGEARRAVERFLLQQPGADFEAVARQVLPEFEGNVVLNVISPRMFESIACGAAMVLFPGDYSGVLEPEAHYIPLRKDFSNFEDVVERLRDVDALQQMADRAHADVVAPGLYSYRHFAASIDDRLEAAHARLRSDPLGRGASADVPGTPVSPAPPGRAPLAWSWVRARTAGARLLDPRRFYYPALARVGRFLWNLRSGLGYGLACLASSDALRVFRAHLQHPGRFRRAALVAALKLGALAGVTPGRDGPVCSAPRLVLPGQVHWSADQVVEGIHRGALDELHFVLPKSRHAWRGRLLPGEVVVSLGPELAQVLAGPLERLLAAATAVGSLAAADLMTAVDGDDEASA